MALAGLAAMLSVGLFSVCFVRIAVLFSDGGYESSDDNNFPTVQVSGSCMALAMILSWISCCMTHRHGRTLTRTVVEVYHEPLQPSSQTEVVTMPAHREYTPEPAYAVVVSDSDRQQPVAPPAYEPHSDHKVEWVQYTANDGRPYYHNPQSGETSWSHPGS
jgi:hypothetical protein